MKIKKRFLIPVLVLTILTIVFFAGPKPNYPTYTGKIDLVDLPVNEVENYIFQKEAKIKNLRKGNESFILWADSLKQKTKYAVVYLHGFSASPLEGHPIHREFAERYACNLYVPLLAGHGIEGTESFIDLTPKELLESAKEAITIGKILGEKVIVMSCSTGSTLSAFLAAENPSLIDAQMMYSPNIDIADPTSKVATLPWGLKILQYAMGGKYRSYTLQEAAMPYWTTTYRLEGIISLRTLLNETMIPSTFEKIKQPLYLGYYYKNEEEKDKVISIPALKDFFEKVKTPENKKRIQAFPEVGAHVMLSSYQAKDLSKVRKETFKFAEDILKLKNILK